MKTLKYILLGCVTAFAVMACTDKEIYTIYPDYDEDPGVTGNEQISSDNPYFTATDDGGEIAYKTKGGEVVINVSCHSAWTAEVSGDTKSADWLDVDVDCELGTLTVTAGQNTNPEQNTAVIELMTVADKAVFSIITVTQNAAGTPEITVAENTWTAPAAGELTKEIAVESSFDEWSVETSCTWLLVEKLDDAVRLTVKENEVTEERSTEIVLTSSNGKDSDSDIIAVTQEPKVYVTLSSAVLTFYDNGNAKLGSVTVESNFDWDFSYDKDNGWFSISRDGDTLTATVSSENGAEDNREGVVTVTAGDGLANVTEFSLRVTQLGTQGASLMLVYTVDAGGTIQLPLAGTVDCTVDWGDTTSDTITSTYPTHKYDSAGEYVVTITGTVTALDSKSVTSSYRKLLTDIVQWGLTGLTTLDYAFYYCVGLDSVPGDDTGAFTDVTSATYMFSYAGSGSTSKDPSTAEGLAHVSGDLFQYAENCTTFERVFEYCYNLQEIPEGLFRNCKSATSFKYAFSRNVNLRSIPADLFDGCPEVTDMTYTFVYCTQLSAIPDGLFSKCTKVNNIGYCFQNCSSLTSIPDGVFDNLTECENFQYLFQNCSALDKIPANLFAFNTKSTSFKYTFNGCSSLLEIPEGIFDDMTACTTLECCFYNCSSLTSVSANLLKDMTACETIKSLFYGCTNLTEIPAGLLDNLPSCTEMNGVFRETSISTVPADLFKNCSAVTDIQNLFYKCANLTEVPEGLFDGLVSVTNMASLFTYCTALESVPADLLKNNLALTNVNYMFRYDENFKEIPEGFFTNNTLLEYMTYSFYGTGITSIPDDFLPTSSTTLKSMSYLFSNCLGITEIPAGKFAGKLPHASSLTIANMFNGCTNLKTVGDKAFYDNDYLQTISAAFSGCTALESVGESAFEGCAELKTVTGFTGCTALKKIGKRAFADCGGASGSASKMFQSLTALEEVGEELFADFTNLTDVSYIFDGCSALKSVPANIFSNCSAVTNASYAFRNSGLTSIAEGLFANIPAITTVSYTFSGCEGLTSIPAGLFDKNTLITTFSYAFKGCSNITSESPYTEINGVKVHLYERGDYPDYFSAPKTTTQCFNGCTNMSDYSSLPSGWY